MDGGHGEAEHARDRLPGAPRRAAHAEPGEQRQHQPERRHEPPEQVPALEQAADQVDPEHPGESPGQGLARLHLALGVLRLRGATREDAFAVEQTAQVAQDQDRPDPGGDEGDHPGQELQPTDHRVAKRERRTGERNAGEESVELDGRLHRERGRHHGGQAERQHVVLALAEGARAPAEEAEQRAEQDAHRHEDQPGEQDADQELAPDEHGGGDRLHEQGLQRSRLPLAGKRGERGVAPAGEQHEHCDQGQDAAQEGAAQVLVAGDVDALELERARRIGVEQRLDALRAQLALQLPQRSSGPARGFLRGVVRAVVVQPKESAARHDGIGTGVEHRLVALRQEIEHQLALALPRLPGALVDGALDHRQGTRRQFAQLDGLLLQEQLVEARLHRRRRLGELQGDLHLLRLHALLGDLGEPALAEEEQRIEQDREDKGGEQCAPIAHQAEELGVHDATERGARGADPGARLAPHASSASAGSSARRTSDLKMPSRYFSPVASPSSA